MIVDIVVANLQIRAFEPDVKGQHFPMLNDDVGKVLFFNMTYSSRLNNRIFGNLRGKALKKAGLFQCRVNMAA
jgi:hypothetical protein